MIRCFIFGKFPGVHPSWTLAVEAMSARDARAWVRAIYRGGYLLARPELGAKIAANCGAMTDAAQLFLYERTERELAEARLKWPTV